MASTTNSTPQVAVADKAKEAKPKAKLTGDRLAFVVANARPAESPCLCGCGGTTKTRFVPGHDAKLKSLLAATVADGTKAEIAKAKSALAILGW